MQCGCGSGRECSETASEDRGDRWSDGCIEKISWQDEISDYVKDMEEGLKGAKPDRVFITHSGCDQQIVQSVIEYLEGLQVFEEILVTRAGCVVSSHCGPGTLGVLYIEK